MWDKKWWKHLPWPVLPTLPYSPVSLSITILRLLRLIVRAIESAYHTPLFVVCNNVKNYVINSIGSLFYDIIGAFPKAAHMAYSAHSVETH